jgi:hypothetical protein
MTEPRAKAPEGMHTITPHIVVSDAAGAADWCTHALGAEERSRIEVSGGKLMQVELWFGDSAVMLADEFPAPFGLRTRAESFASMSLQEWPVPGHGKHWPRRSRTCSVSTRTCPASTQS